MYSRARQRKITQVIEKSFFLSIQMWFVGIAEGMVGNNQMPSDTWFSQIRCCIPRGLQRVQRVLPQRNQKDPTTSNTRTWRSSPGTRDHFSYLDAYSWNWSQLRLWRRKLSERDPAFGSQAVNRCVLLPEQYPATQIRTNHKEGRPTDSRRVSTRSTYRHTGGRSAHTRTEPHRTNHARQGTDDG